MTRVTTRHNPPHPGQAGLVAYFLWIQLLASVFGFFDQRPSGPPCVDRSPFTSDFFSQVTALTRKCDVNYRSQAFCRRQCTRVTNMKASAIVIPIVPDIEIKRILYATDFSEASLAALPLVSTVAHKYGSRVFVVNVWTPIPYSMVSPEAASVLQRKDELEARAKAQAILNRKDLAGLSATAIVQTGSPAEELKWVVRNEKLISPSWAPMAAPD